MIGNANARGLRLGRIAAMAVLAAGVVAAPTHAVSPPESRKMSRQIEVLEKILDQVLLDSPNFLIRSTPVARGAYLEGWGALFTFDASLTGKDWEELKIWDNLDGFRIEKRDGKQVIILGPDRDVLTVDDEGPETGAEDEEEGGDWRDARRRQHERTYLRGKTELVDLILDYGDTLSTLKPNQWIAIMAYMTDDDFIDRNRISRLILKAKMSDLRAYGAGDLSEEEMIKRIVEQEY